MPSGRPCLNPFCAKPRRRATTEHLSSMAFKFGTAIVGFQLGTRFEEYEVELHGQR